MPIMYKDHGVVNIYEESVTTTGTLMYLPSVGSGLYKLLHCEMYTDYTEATQVAIFYRWKNARGAWVANKIFDGYIDAVNTGILERQIEIVGPFQIYCWLPGINTSTYNVTLMIEYRKLEHGGLL